MRLALKFGATKSFADGSVIFWKRTSAVNEDADGITGLMAEFVERATVVDWWCRKVMM